MHHSTLRAWAGRGLRERAVLFQRCFPDRSITHWQLRRIYKANGIKRKVIRVTHMPANKNDGRYDHLIDAMRSKVQYAVNASRKLLFIDEVCFTKHTQKTCEWSNKRHNIFIPCESMHVKFHAVIAAISYDVGVEHFVVLDEAANHESFAEFAHVLFKKYEGEEITVVLDNLAVHFHDDVKTVY